MPEPVGEIGQESWTPNSADRSPLAQTAARWAEGVRHTHDNFWADPTQFVGPVPADEHQAVEAQVLAALPDLLAFAEWAMFYLDAEGGCRYDHHGYCQSHGLDERPCPVEVAYDLLRQPRVFGSDKPGGVA